MKPATKSIIPAVSPIPVPLTLDVRLSADVTLEKLEAATSHLCMVAGFRWRVGEPFASLDLIPSTGFIEVQQAKPVGRWSQRFRYEVAGQWYGGCCLPSLDDDGDPCWHAVTETNIEEFWSDPWEVLGQVVGDCDRFQWIDNDNDWHSDEPPAAEFADCVAIPFTAFKEIASAPRLCGVCSDPLDPGFCYASCLKCQAKANDREQTSRNTP